MILQSLVEYYEALANRGEISRPGWTKSKISYCLNIDNQGQLLSIVPMKLLDDKSKKYIPQQIELPSPVGRTVGIMANFGWDNGEYMLGLNIKGNPKRSMQCFEAAKELHLKLVENIADPFAQAICAFFNNWNVAIADENPNIVEIAEDLKAGANLALMYNFERITDNKSLKMAWQKHYDKGESGKTMRCLITGESVIPEVTHPKIKNVRDAQSSGAAIISFNAPSFCSYNREQNLNAPVSKYAAFAYTTALNRLLSDKENVSYIGDSSVVFWAECAENQYQNAFQRFLSDDNSVSNKDLVGIMESLSAGGEVDWDGLPLKPDNRFYVLGLSPNASRISIRFFLRDSFGNFVKHTKAHYDRLQIIKPDFEKSGSLPVWRLLQETVNQKSKDKKANAQMSGDVMRAILSGGKYPSTFYQGVQLRIRADREINYVRAAIIKAYLLQKYDGIGKEALTVQLNEETKYQPYILGRLFSVLEGIQQMANPGINTTIKDKYLSAACVTPAKIFPILLNLSEKHLRKMEKGASIYHAKQVQELMALVTETYPVHHTLEEQGIFQIGYYHQQQKRYEKKKIVNNEEGTENA